MNLLFADVKGAKSSLHNTLKISTGVYTLPGTY